MTDAQRLPLSRQILYAIGTAGWTATDRLVTSFALFFYLPPAGRGLPARLEERAVLGLTMFGAIMILGRVVDSVADPLVAAWSDRHRSSLGRRRVFLLWGAVPLALVTAAIFVPPTRDPSALNALFLALALAGFFFLFTVYVVPYLALIPELAPTPAARLALTTQQAFMQLGGAALVMIGAPSLVSALGGGTRGYQGAIGATCALAAVLMLLPAAAIDERRHAAPVTGEQPPLWASLRLTLANRPFLLYLGGNIAYWFAFNIVSAAALYVTTVLMRADEAFQSVALIATFGVAAASFVPWNRFAHRAGKRPALLMAGVGFVVAMVAMALVRDRASGLIAFALFGAPVGALLVLPNAALADCTDYDWRRTGSRREAMFFGAQGLLLKVNLGVSSAVLAGLMAIFGKDPGHDLGIRLAGAVAAALVMLGMASFWKYPEDQVLEATDVRGPLPGSA
ncbi:MAG TPA: MFS transporter [Candidatus Eisenbacteria bacterium]|jgi:GPH family glycoside/pentoside/hexuronide:cation symporter